jgi:type II secretory pathway pseudopilin PulG
MCGAEIAAGAPRCRFCGEVLATGHKQTNWFGRLVTGLTVLAILAVVVAMLLPSVRRARPAARRSQCKNNLKQIGLALYNYEADYHAFPPAYTVDADGKPLHSWRTLILPYLDQQPLYARIDLSKPWDDPANARRSKPRCWSIVAPLIRDQPVTRRTWPVSENTPVFAAQSHVSFPKLPTALPIP